MSSSCEAVVLLGHGSRAPKVSEAMERVADVLRGRRSERIEVAHMELCEPTLDSVLGTLHADGIRHVALVPYFLHRGVHLREDVPGILASALAELPGLEVVVAPHLGFDDAIVDLVENSLEQALTGGRR